MESRSDELPYLIAQAGPLNGQYWILDKRLILGREPDCDIVISNRQVSRHHACLSIGTEGVFLEDLGSKNGVLINNKPLSGPTLLTDGAVFQIALVQRFIYLSSDSTIPLDNQPGYFQDFTMNKQKSLPVSLRNGRLRLEKRSRQVWIRLLNLEGRWEEKEILPPLSVSQFRLLEVLFDNPGRVIPRPELAAAIWGEGQAFDISEQALDALVRRLRDRIASIDPEHEFIVTVRGHGLRLENPS